jgi:putative DNA primase/helicase
VILAALFMVLANRYDWQLFLEVTGPGGSGKSILAEIATMLAGKITPRRPPSKRWNRPRACSLIGFSLIRLPDQEKWSGDGADLRPSPAAMRSPLTRNTRTPIQRISRR